MKYENSKNLKNLFKSHSKQLGLLEAMGKNDSNSNHSLTKILPAK